MEKTYNIVYQITNVLNGKYYIGVHSTNKLEDGYMGSGKILKEDIRLCGVENFSREILHYYDTREEAFKKESELVTIEFIKNENVYNLIQGGIGVIYSHSKKIQPIEIKKELFERFNNKYFLNVTYNHSGKRQEIFEETESQALNKINKVLTDLWYERGNRIAYQLTLMLNNKFTHEKGVSFLAQVFRFPVMASSIKISRMEWGQLNMFNNGIQTKRNI